MKTELVSVKISGQVLKELDKLIEVFEKHSGEVWSRSEAISYMIRKEKSFMRSEILKKIRNEWKLFRWTKETYKRRSVSDITQFIGWDYLTGLLDKTVNPRDRALISLMFETGGRVSEVLQLTKSNFLFHRDFIIVQAMTVLKRYKKIDKEIREDNKEHWITERVKGFRTFPLSRKEPLIEYFLEYVENKKENIFRIGRKRVYQIVVGMDQNIFPHWFRSQRACQLALEYGFTIHDLVDFFNWKDLNTAIHYSRMGWKGLASKMR